MRESHVSCVTLDRFDYLFKLLIVGDDKVGKSCFLQRYVDNTFTESYISTIGIDFKVKTITINNKKVKLQIWDTAGQERFRNITTSYYRGSMGIIIMFDVTKKTSFDNVKKYIQDTLEYSANAKKVIVGNKADLADKREITTEHAMNYMHDPSEDIPYVEVSAKTNTNIDAVFDTLASDLINDKSQQPSSEKCAMVAPGEPMTDRGDIGALDDGSAAVDYTKLEDESLVNKIYKGRSQYKSILSMGKANLKKYINSKIKLVERFSDVASIRMDTEEDLRILAIMINSLENVES